MIDGNLAMNSHFENMSEKDQNEGYDNYIGELVKKESIAFAEWLDEEVYNNNLSRVRARNSVHYGKWAYSKGVPNPQFFTTAELFQLLKQSKKC